MGAFFFELKSDGNIDTVTVETCTTASGYPMTPSKREACASLFNSSGIQATGLVALHPDVHVGFQVVGLGTEDGLYARTCHYHTGSAQFLQTGLVNLGHVFHTDPQTGDAGVQRSDVLFATEGRDQCGRHLVLALTNALFGRFVFTARGFQVHGTDDHGEDHVVDDGIDQTQTHQQQHVIGTRDCTTKSMKPLEKV